MFFFCFRNNDCLFSCIYSFSLFLFIRVLVFFPLNIYFVVVCLLFLFKFIYLWNKINFFYAHKNKTGENQMSCLKATWLREIQRQMGPASVLCFCCFFLCLIHLLSIVVVGFSFINLVLLAFGFGFGDERNQMKLKNENYTESTTKSKTNRNIDETKEKSMV